HERRDGDCGQDANDRDDDHELDQREAFYCSVANPCEHPLLLGQSRVERGRYEVASGLSATDMPRPIRPGPNSFDALHIDSSLPKPRTAVFGPWERQFASAHTLGECSIPNYMNMCQLFSLSAGRPSPESSAPGSMPCLESR